MVDSHLTLKQLDKCKNPYFQCFESHLSPTILNQIFQEALSITTAFFSSGGLKDNQGQGQYIQ